MKKTNQKRTSIITEREFSTKEMSEFLLETFPQLNEAFTRADIELALDDRGWLVPGRQWTAADLDSQTRTTLVAKSRLYWMRDPLMKQAVRLWTDYALGDGFTYSCTDKPTMKKLDSFMKDRRNRRLTNSEGQRRSSKKVLVDGEVFFAIFDDGDGKVIRRIDPLQVTDIICDPDDDEHVLGYRRLTAQDKIIYYKDWTCDDDDLGLFQKQKDPALKVAIKDIEEDVVVVHVPFDTLLKRGNGLLFAAVDWSKEHRRFMEARVAITQALAKFAWGAKVKGGQAIVNAVQAKLQSTYATAGATMIERHPQSAPGSTLVHNEGLDMTPIPRTTGASDAASDGNQIKLMVCAATGIMLHYFGDPSTGNLATATAMELPMLKQFLSYQTFWKEAYRDIFSVVLEEEPGEDTQTITMNVPPILEDDLQKLGSFIQQVAGVFPEMKIDDVLREVLNSLNIPNLDDVMEKIAVNKAALDATAAVNKAATAAALAASTTKPTGDGADPNLNKAGGANDPKAQLAQQSNGIPTNPESAYGTTEAAQLKLLTEAITKLSEKL